MAQVLALPFRALGFAAARRAGRWLLALGAIAIVAAAAYRLWLRDSSLVAVREVKVVGLSADNAARVRSTLTGEALTMTTLHLRTDDLRAAVRPYPTVRSLSVERDFPHGLVIHVTEHEPASVVRAGGRSVPIAPDGGVLAGISAAGDLPRISTDSAPRGSRLDGGALDQALVLGAAPPDVRSRIGGSSERGGEVTVRLDGGVRLLFGEPARIGAKWAAALRVLADPRIDQLSYLDLTVPERPAVGGTGVAPAAPDSVYPALPPAVAAAPEPPASTSP